MDGGGPCASLQPSNEIRWWLIIRPGRWECKLYSTRTSIRTSVGAQGHIAGMWGVRIDSPWWVPMDTVGCERERTTMHKIYVYMVILCINYMVIHAV